MLRFKSLGSGSSGNATVVESTGRAPVRVLIDCGLGPRVLARRLGEAGLGLEDLDAIFITHEHGDHIGCAPSLAVRHGIPIWMSEGTWQGSGEPELGPLLQLACDGTAIDLGDLELRPFSVPHDAREPLQLRLSDGDRTLGIATDLGHVPNSVLAHLEGCQAMLLESIPDPQMLSESAYPAFLKRRVGGDLGHLSNAQAAGMATALQTHLKSVLAAHLSQTNNRPDLVHSALRQALGDGVDIAVAHAATGSPWIQV